MPMTEIIVSIISGILTLLGVCLTAWFSNRSIAGDVAARLDISQAVTDARLSELTREVREHNHFARRMPVVEEQIKVINHRILDLEKEAK